MNKTKIQELLIQWSELIDSGEQSSKEKADKGDFGLLGRIKRTTGDHIIFDYQNNEQREKVQDLLCKEMPEWDNVIRSEPEIMDGYSWTRKDFIELYFEHFRLVIEKLKRISDV